MGNVEMARKNAANLKGIKEGSVHWLAQRVSAIALIPLGFWFVTSVIYLAGADYLVWRGWVASPWTLGLLALFLITSLRHAYLGLQVVFEDYIADHAIRYFVILFVQFLAWLIGAIGLAVLLMIFIGR